MKTAYKIVLTALFVLALAWFLPWLYSFTVPSAGYDPFVAYSPVCGEFVITDTNGDDIVMFSQSGQQLTIEQRDSLLPQIFYTQLAARQKMPDSIKGVEMSLPNIRHHSWVFSTRPSDISMVQPKVYMMMESAPARFELESPEMAFRLNGIPEFINMDDNTVNDALTRRFTKVFEKEGFAYPPKSLSANISTHKSYDEGYLMADANGDIYHVKMRASSPYMVKVDKPDSVLAAHVFILENDDPSHLGLICDTNHNLYALEREGYRLVRLPVKDIDPTRDRLMIMADPFCWVVKISNREGARWAAISASDYSLLSTYEHKREVSANEKIAKYIFPLRVSITDPNDSYARLRLKSPWN